MTAPVHHFRLHASLMSLNVAVGRLAVIVIGSWCVSAANVSLQLDWKALGLNPATSIVSTPNIPGWQRGATPVSSARLGTHGLEVAAGQGAVITVRPTGS